MAAEAMAAIIHDIAGPDVPGESTENREARFQLAGRFLYETLAEAVRVRAMLISKGDIEAAAAAVKQ
jgi:hypothetical protein